jgi:hypothetical protein
MGKPGYFGSVSSFVGRVTLRMSAPAARQSVQNFPMRQSGKSAARRRCVKLSFQPRSPSEADGSSFNAPQRNRYFLFLNLRRAGLSKPGRCC